MTWGEAPVNEKGPDCVSGPFSRPRTCPVEATGQVPGSADGGSVRVEVPFEHLRERRHGLLGPLALGAQSHLVALVRPEGQQHQDARSEEHTSELQSRFDLVCRLLLEKK